MEMKIGKLATLTVKNRKAAVAEVKIDWIESGAQDKGSAFYDRSVDFRSRVESVLKNNAFCLSVCA